MIPDDAQDLDDVAAEFGVDLRPSLTDFLLARIAEDEARRDAGHDKWCPRMTSPQFVFQSSEPCECPRKRVLAELEAKRAIVDEHADYGGYGKSCQTCAEGIDLTPWPCRTLRILANIYANHPDYQQEWKP